LESAVATIVLNDRTNVDVPLVPGDAQQQVLETILPILVAEAQVRSEEEARTALDSLYDTSFAERATS
jgi:sulfonate transport system substrate-binding protein